MAPPTDYIGGTDIPVELERWNASPIRDQKTKDFSTGHFYIPPSEDGLDEGRLPNIPGYEVWHSQGPDAGQIAKLRNAGVRVFIKKQAAPNMEAQLDSQKGAENSSRAWWTSKVFPAAFAGPENAVLPAPSFLTVDALCHAHWHAQEPSDIMSRDYPNAFGLLGVGAGLPGATWCGNAGLMQSGKSQAEAMEKRFLSCVEDGEGLMEYTRGQQYGKNLVDVEDRMKFAGLDQRHVFVASCLGWHERSLDMRFELPVEDFEGHTRSCFTFIQPDRPARARINTTMVSQLKPRDGEMKTPQENPAGSDDPDIQKIKKKLAEQRADLLVFIAFGSQGFDFAREALEGILVNAAAVEHSLVYLVLPTGWSIEEAPAFGGYDESGNTSQVGTPRVAGGAFMSVAGGKNKASRPARKEPVTIIRGSDPASRIELADNMMAVPFPAPQSKIFGVFSPLSQNRVKTIFISHGGAGSIAEAVGRRIPILGLGLGVDQPGNCADVAAFGLGLDGRRLVHDFRVNHSYIHGPGGPGSCLCDIFSFPAQYHQDLLSPEEYLQRDEFSRAGSPGGVRTVGEKEEEEARSPRSRLLAIAAQRSSERGSPVYDIFRGLGYIREHWEQFQERFARKEERIAKNTMHNGEALTNHFLEILKETTWHEDDDSASADGGRGAFFARDAWASWASASTAEETAPRRGNMVQQIPTGALCLLLEPNKAEAGKELQLQAAPPSNHAGSSPATTSAGPSTPTSWEQEPPPTTTDSDFFEEVHPDFLEEQEREFLQLQQGIESMQLAEEKAQEQPWVGSGDEKGPSAVRRAGPGWISGPEEPRGAADHRGGGRGRTAGPAEERGTTFEELRKGLDSMQLAVQQVAAQGRGNKKPTQAPVRNHLSGSQRRPIFSPEARSPPNKPAATQAGGPRKPAQPASVIWKPWASQGLQRPEVERPRKPEVERHLPASGGVHLPGSTATSPLPGRSPPPRSPCPQHGARPSTRTSPEASSSRRTTNAAGPNAAGRTRTNAGAPEASRTRAINGAGPSKTTWPISPEEPTEDSFEALRKGIDSMEFTVQHLRNRLEVRSPRVVVDSKSKSRNTVGLAKSRNSGGWTLQNLGPPKDRAAEGKAKQEARGPWVSL